MCDPLSLLAIGGAVSAGVQVKGAIDAKKDRKRAAREAKKTADEQKRVADDETRAARKDEYSARRSSTPRNPQVAGGSLFAPRSFFSVA